MFSACASVKLEAGEAEELVVEEPDILVHKPEYQGVEGTVGK